MKRIDLDQDTPEWLAERRKSVGGSDAHGFLPPSRGREEHSAGWWDYVARQLTKPADAEDPRDRGHRLEEEAVLELASITGLEFDLKPGLWRSDDGTLHISSDGAEPVDEPTYDAEIKCLNAGKHFKYLDKRRNWRGDELNLVPNEMGAYYKDQVLHAFLVNPKLKTRYFFMYNPDAIYQEHRGVLIVINRDEIGEDLTEYAARISNEVSAANAKIDELIGDNF